MSKEQIVPIGDYLLVSVEQQENQSGPLILNGDAPDNRGVVQAIGDKVNTDEDSTKINTGDKIIFNPGTGIRVTNADDSDILLSVKNVIGIIREDN